MNALLMLFALYAVLLGADTYVFTRCGGLDFGRRWRRLFSKKDKED